VSTEALRLDKYLWAIRVFKTRTQAATAIKAGKVTLGGSPVKTSKNVTVGDVYNIKAEERKWVIEVTGLLHQRVQYSEAINFYVDRTPAADIINK
jgi:ribosome-associated heat shock protein Hsp15